jgi:UDP-N-acetylmuramoylalanine--D-glutamate ligase
MLDLKGQKITIIGGKRSGLGLAKLIVRQKGIPKISEQAPRSSMEESFLKFIDENKIATEFGGHTKDFIHDSDMVVLSPGVRYDAQPVKWAKEKDILVLGEIEFAYQFCSKPVIAVTGSNGKTTTVNLITQVLQKAGKRPCLCGNVGSAFSNFVLDLNDVDYIILEVSSFQLESLLDPQSAFRQKGKMKFYVNGFKPLVGIILNFSQNHLDRHKDLQEYFEAKSRLFINQNKEDFAVLNSNDEHLKSLANHLKSQVKFFDSPGQRKDIPIKNPNQLAVAIVSDILGVPKNIYLDVFKEFKGVEHRLELVRVLEGVDYVNDSKATTAEASRWALNNIDKPILMICGGRDKHIDFSVLKNIVQKKVKKMYVIGEAREKLKETFGDVVALNDCENLESAVEHARRDSKKGDCVVLSPMCASFDMFKDYEHRGKVFKQIVSTLS